MENPFITVEGVAASHSIEDGLDMFWKKFMEQMPTEPPMPDKMKAILFATAKSGFYSGASWACSTGTDHARDEVKRAIGVDPTFTDN